MKTEKISKKQEQKIRDAQRNLQQMLEKIAQFTEKKQFERRKVVENWSSSITNYNE